MRQKGKDGSMRREWNFILIILLSLSFNFSIGCKGIIPEKGGKKEVKVEPKPAIKEKVKEEKEEAEEVHYSYSPIGKRDPFRSFISKELLTPAEGGLPLTPLQKWELDQLTLVGIVWGIPSPKAMVEDPSGMGYVIEKGTLIGKNWGKVAKITNNEVIIAEEYRDLEGKLIVNEVTMKLREETEEGGLTY